MEDFRDDELKKWLAEEYEKEIDEMEEVLFPNGVLPDDGETEEEAKAAYKKLVDRLKADGVYEEDEPEKVKIVYLPEKKRHKAAKVAAAVLVCAAGVFAASMTSQANRSYFIDSVKVWTGNDTKISVDNDPNSDESDSDEQLAVNEIKDTLNIKKFPNFMYRPQGFKFRGYEINVDMRNVDMRNVLMEYDYYDTLITLYINDYGNTSKNTDYILDGRIIAELTVEDEKFKIDIKRIKDKQDKKESYIAYWKEGDFFYQISGKMDEKEFLKLIKNIRF